MTMTRTIRKRLKRYALACLMAATTAGFMQSSPRLFAEGTHDTQSLCGWVEETTRSPTDCEKDVLDQSKKGEEKSLELSHEDIHFFAVEFSDTLTIDTCNYGDWLGKTLSGSELAKDSPEAKASSEAKVSAEAKVSETEELAVTAVDGETVANAAVKADTESATYLGRIEPPRVGSAPSRTSSSFNQTMAAIAAAATAGNPLPFGHWTEPFAMVGPAGSHSLPEIETFQEWFACGTKVVSDAVAMASVENQPLDDLASIDKDLSGLTNSVSEIAEANDFVPVVDFDGNVCGFELVETTPASETKPSDVVGQSALDQSPTFVAPSFVGSSPVIATIKEAYAPYDLAERDREQTREVIEELVPAVLPESMSEEKEDAAEQLVWADGLFSPSGQPFCVRSFAEMKEPGWSPLASNTLADGFPTEEINSVPEVGVYGSADCLLDELVWFVGTTLQEESVTDEWFQPKKIGENVALLVVSSNDIFSQFTQELASVWPARPKNVKPILNAGAQLLARAEAAEQTQNQGSPKPDGSRELAQATATLLQWVDAAESVIDNVSKRFNVVTEVARNRGTQLDSARR